MGVVRVVRVERNGIGPFQGIMKRSDDLYSMIYKQLAKSDHVSCTVEANGFRGLEGYLFACETESDLYEYFGDEAIDYMLTKGFEIKWYEVDENSIVYGRGELAFLPTSTHRKLYKGLPLESYGIEVKKIDWGKEVANSTYAFDY